MTNSHPKGLYYLFFTEMWERFSYYGMRALLVYYMTKHLLMTQAMSSQVYGLYTGFVYFTPFFGGMLADKVLGQRKTVILGGILMAIGHFMMAFETLFYPALIFLILGNGAFKPNISTQVGFLYEQGDHRRDRAFSIFYMGINLGAFFSPLVCGTLGELYGWHYGFAAAGIGMIIGLLIYLSGQKHLAADRIMKKKASNVKVEEEKFSKNEWSRIIALIILCIFNIVFWATYEQQGNTLALWADANTNRMLFGFEIPASWFQSLNPMLIFLLIPLTNIFWSKQAAKNKEPSSVSKMAIGCIVLGLSFLVMIVPSNAVLTGEKVSMLWLCGCIFLLTVGEIYLSPVGLSLVTKVSPAKIVSMMMGMWFLSSFFGNYLSGYIGTYWEVITKTQFFILLSALSIGAGLGMFIVKNKLKKALRNLDE